MVGQVESRPGDPCGKLLNLDAEELRDSDLAEKLQRHGSHSKALRPSSPPPPLDSLAPQRFGFETSQLSVCDDKEVSAPAGRIHETEIWKLV